MFDCTYATSSSGDAWLEQDPESESKVYISALTHPSWVLCVRVVRKGAM